ncbi:pyridoxine 5'-phosphate synthase [Helicobacter turcicus]|uniref:Pyridoxine 5'-phosphate synthase n=1 Tax=Helicobacter turcicus TaxID=2867412 RepID=A0ABS7JMC3_9HELI|nr:pyridoxine 5'-phosphate synthase [Helicobacter turcicus]MBX7490540.1 pyridoxine 5'-phosphate synthase [Helicobacter turcicus]MBX7545550.1 pyridoxine 5'-phosphate synthase [Helicobacter turcicus]
MLLGVNIDHIATLREARKINDPDPLEAVFIAKRAGADQITLHLREDRRHIHDKDVLRIRDSSALPLNIECSINPSVIDFILKASPHRITLVPENRQEITTEGGLDVVQNFDKIAEITRTFQQRYIEVSLFIDTQIDQICASKEVGAQRVELHTGTYANLHLMLNSNLPYTHNVIEELKIPASELKTRLQDSIVSLHDGAKEAKWLGLEVAAGHGLNYNNLTPILAIPEITELNIGQSIIARSIFTGLESAIKEMVALIKPKIKA